MILIIESAKAVISLALTSDCGSDRYAASCGDRNISSPKIQALSGDSKSMSLQADPQDNIFL